MYMSQVSKIPLKIEVEHRVYEVLMESIAAATSHNTVSRLINDLLSPTERLMISKRLSIALLLMKNYDQRTIAKWLNVSLGTVSKISLVLQKGSGGYQSVIEVILKKEKFAALLEKIDDALVNAFGPPRRTDWKQWYANIREEKSARSKAF